MTRSLVVNGDDLGLTVGVNNGIFDSHDRGILTSASVFANAPATADATRRARIRPSLGIGVHLALVEGAPLWPPARVPTLVEADGRFRRSWRSFVSACLRGNVACPELERELTAQIDRIRAEGIVLTHLDAHKHVHAIPSVFAIVVRLARRFGIATVRVPYERWSGVNVDEGHRSRGCTQALANLAMLPWAMQAYRMAAAEGVRVPQFVGRVQTGVMTAGSLRATLLRLHPGVTELMVHPGYVDDALRQTATRLLASRADETDLLCSADIHQTIQREAIDLVCHALARLGRSIPTGVCHDS